MRRRRRKTQPRAATPKVAALDTNQGKAPQFPFPLCRGSGSRQGGALGSLGAYRQGLRERKGRESRGTALPRRGGRRPSRALQAGLAVPARPGEEDTKMETASESIPRVRPCWPTFCPFCVSGQDQIMLTIPHTPSKANSSQLGRPHHPRPSIQAGGWAPLQDHKPSLASLVFGLKGMDTRPPKADRSQVGPLNQRHLPPLKCGSGGFFFLMGARNSQCPPKNSNEEKQ